MVRVDITGVKDLAGLVFLVVEARALSGMLGSSVVRTSAAVLTYLGLVNQCSSWRWQSKQTMYLGLWESGFSL